MEKHRLIAVIALLCAAVARPCSFDTTPTFAFNVRPDEPIDRYVAGHLGVLRPTYARSHLVVAYRHLSGNPPSEAERAGFTDLLSQRLSGAYPTMPGHDRWKKLRDLIRGGDDDRIPGHQRYSATHDYSWFANCNDDAFATATSTLANRVRILGVSHPGVKSWLDAQDVVFANCVGGESRPAPAPASLPEIIRLDREYQLAAADFYAMRYDDARARFLAVGRDPRSPWRQTARLVAVRALIRKGVMSAPVVMGEPLDAAELELRAILDDPSMAPMHEAARDLLAFVTFRTKPPRRFAETVNGLTRGESSARRARVDLGDYTYLLDRDVDREIKKVDDMTDWVRTFQDANGFAHALERWRATKTAHWLVAALTHATAKDAGPLLDASSQIAASSPAYASVAYHRARLLRGRGETSVAREELDHALSNDELPQSARNLLFEHRRSLATSIDDYLRHAQPVPVGVDVEQLPEDFGDPMIASDVAVLVNLAMPVETLAEAAKNETLADGIRGPLIVAAWTRAVLLGRDDIALAVEPLLAKTYPALEKRLATWTKATGEDRRYASIDILVHSPALRPYVLPLVTLRPDPADVFHSQYPDMNWWCRDGRAFFEEPRPPVVPPFLETADDERAQLDAQGSGATWLLRNTMAWAKARPKDSRVPEALSLAIHGTNWACADAATRQLARSAFNRLHSQYPNTQWANETKYWYAGFQQD